MKFAETGDAPQVFGHWGEEGPTLSKTERVGHPRVILLRIVNIQK
jgi:hypothetical protein